MNRSKSRFVDRNWNPWTMAGWFIFVPACCLCSAGCDAQDPGIDPSQVPARLTYRLEWTFRPRIVSGENSVIPEHDENPKVTITYVDSTGTEVQTTTTAYHNPVWSYTFNPKPATYETACIRGVVWKGYKSRLRVSILGDDEQTLRDCLVTTRFAESSSEWN